MRDFLGGLGDEACLGEIAGACTSVRLGVGEFGPGREPLGDDLIWRPAAQHTLAAGVVGGVEAAQQLLELAMGPEGDAEHLGADAAVEALDHAVGLGRSGTGVTILGAKGGTGTGEGGGEAAAVVGQHVGEAERERRRGLAQEGDGALLGLIVLDREVDGARAPVDGNVEIALAPLAVAGLQLGQVLDVDVHEAEVVVAERALALGGAFGNGLGPAVQPLGFEDAPDVVAAEMGQEVGDHEGEVVEGEVGGPAQATDDGSLFLARLPRQPVRSGGAVQAVRGTALAPLADGLGADAIAPGESA